MKAEELLAELKKVNDEIDAAYWRFTRSTSPKAKLAPAATYKRRVELCALLDKKGVKVAWHLRPSGELRDG